MPRMFGFYKLLASIWGIYDSNNDDDNSNNDNNDNDDVDVDAAA